MASNTTSNWEISTDIYNIVETVEKLKKRYIDEDESTLSMGIFGYVGDIESKKIQSAIIETGELGNEMFPSRAKLDKNILTHAIYQNVEDINAEPSFIVCNIGIKVSDLDKYMKNGRFIFDRDCPIYVGNYEFHFDYDVILQRNQTATMSEPVYSVRYDMDIKNNISKVETPYLKQPYVVNMYNKKYVIFQATLRQLTIEWTTDKLITESIIDNKTFVFEFTNQIADFTVYVTEASKTTRLVPLFYGSYIPEDIEFYCWYLYLNDHTIRITFDAASFIPGLNADVTIEAQVTLGSEGNFLYDDSKALFTDFDSVEYGYENVTCYLLPVTDAYEGKDRKSSEVLRKIIPKFALSRGYLTTEKDLDNYFNLINTDNNRLKLQKKVDNQLDRIWYSYLLLKDDYGNIVPTNTVNIKINTKDGSCFLSEDGRYILPSGTYFSFDPKTRLATVIDEADIPELYSERYFNGWDAGSVTDARSGEEIEVDYMGDDEDGNQIWLDSRGVRYNKEDIHDIHNKNLYFYISVFNIAICRDPLYAAFYLTNVNKDSYFIFDWVNENSDLQFIANRNHIERKLLTDRNIYTFTFSMSQSVNSDFKMYYEVETFNTETHRWDTEIVNNMKCFLVIYRGSVPYRWKEFTLVGYDLATWTSFWSIDLDTDNGLDSENNLKLLDLGVIGSDKDKNYGYFETSPKAFVYTCAKFPRQYGRYDLTSMIPGIDEYTVTNKYEIEGGLTLFYNYTYMMNTRILAVDDDVFTMTGFPMVGAHYMIDEDYARMFLDALNNKRAYVDDCLARLENSMDVDLKFFNCYGPSVTFNIGDKFKTMIEHVDIEMKWRMKLASAADVYTKDHAIQFIKEYIEDITDIGTLHIPNLVTKLELEFGDAVEYFEYMNFNKFWLGVQHIVLEEPDNPHVVPEFICIRNKYNEETGKLEPCIDMEVNT